MRTFRLVLALSALPLGLLTFACGGSDVAIGADAAAGSGGLAGSGTGGSNVFDVPACESGVTTVAPDGCNSCTCLDGEWACTERGCSDPPPDPAPCTDGVVIGAGDGCNSCTCTAGTWACTERVCDPGVGGSAGSGAAGSGAAGSGGTGSGATGSGATGSGATGSGGGGARDCVVGGCSGQLCVEEGSMTGGSSCEFLPEYACYETAVCERQDDGQCAWTQTEELKQCLASGGPSPRDCGQIGQAYATAIQAAQSCDPRTDDIQCELSRDKNLACGCPVPVNDGAALDRADALAKQWQDQRCQLDVLCPAIACVSPGKAVCQPRATTGTGTVGRCESQGRL